VVALAVQAQDEHGTAVQVAAGLVGSDFGWSIALGRDIADALAEAAAAEFFGTAEKVDGVIGAVRREAGFHSAEMLVTKGKDVRPHDSGECSIRGRDGGVSSQWLVIGGRCVRIERGKRRSPAKSGEKRLQPQRTPRLRRGPEKSF